MEKRHNECKYCGEAVIWLKGTRQENIPVNADSVDGGATYFDAQQGHTRHWCAKSSTAKGSLFDSVKKQGG